MADTDHDHHTSVGATGGHPSSRRRARRTSVRMLLATAVTGVAGLVAMPASPVAACDSLSIPSLSLDRCVVAGDQPQIDAGNVVRVDRLSSQYVHWVAGHRTSHGATFSSLTDLRTGALVNYRGTTYTIVDYRLVDRFHPDSVYPWMDATTPSLVLQTSAYDVYVHVWRALPASSGMMQLSPVPVDAASAPTAVVDVAVVEQPATVVAVEAEPPVGVDAPEAAEAAAAEVVAPEVVAPDAVAAEAIAAEAIVVDAALLDVPVEAHGFRGRGPRWAVRWV